ncbi:MAG: peptidase M64 [Bacteroidia bacterium]|nr:peptidase M64 [Bacteroidia bacterium]
MKNLFCISLFIIMTDITAQPVFDDYFTTGALRIDYIHAGDKNNEYFFFEQLKKEPFWGGPKKNLIDRFNYGKYKIVVHDFQTDSIIYSHGYSTLFEEWTTTEEAKNLQRSFYETQLVPFPKNKIRIEIYGRDKKNLFHKKYELVVEPANYFISNENTAKYEVYDLHISGNPENKTDIVLIPDGYTINEMEKFKEDAQNLNNYFFETSPFYENKDKFNIRLVLAPSQESGADIPADTVWKNTIINSSFYTFDNERYLMTYNIKALRDVASNVPYDIIYIIVNTDKYGGGAIYNYYAVTFSSGIENKYVFCHEFGHAYAGLADEYYTSYVSYQDFYDLSVEPWEPNLTTLVDFDKKWKNMLEKRIPVPTPEDKKYMDKIGVFEGGGYVPFRPFALSPIPPFPVSHKIFCKLNFFWYKRVLIIKIGEIIIMTSKFLAPPIRETKPFNFVKYIPVFFKRNCSAKYWMISDPWNWIIL